MSVRALNMWSRFQLARFVEVLPRSVLTSMICLCFGPLSLAQEAPISSEIWDACSDLGSEEFRIDPRRPASITPHFTFLQEEGELLGIDCLFVKSSVTIYAVALQLNELAISTFSDVIPSVIDDEKRKVRYTTRTSLDTLQREISLARSHALASNILMRYLSENYDMNDEFVASFTERNNDLVEIMDRAHRILSLQYGYYKIQMDKMNAERDACQARTISDYSDFRLFFMWEAFHQPDCSETLARFLSNGIFE